MALDVTVQPQPCGAIVRGIHRPRLLTREQNAEVRRRGSRSCRKG